MTTFLKINGEDVSIETALQWHMVMGNHEFAQETIRNVALLQYARETGIEASAAEIQRVFNEYRYALGLESSEATRTWLKSHGLNMDLMQQFCEIAVIRNRLRAEITEDEIRERFAEVKSALTKVETYAIYVEAEDQANELRAQVEEGESFLALAREHSMEPETARQGGYLGEMTRGSLAGEIEAVTFAGTEGALIGPAKDDEYWVLYMAGKRVEPDYDQVREELREELFEARILALAMGAEVRQEMLGIEGNPFGDDARYAADGDGDVDEDDDEDSIDEAN